MGDIASFANLLEKAYLVGQSLMDNPAELTKQFQIIYALPVTIDIKTGNGIRKEIEVYPLKEAIGSHFSIDTLNRDLFVHGRRLGCRLHTYEYALFIYSGRGAVYGGVRPTYSESTDVMLIEGFTVLGDHFIQVYGITPNGLTYRGNDLQSIPFIASLFKGMAAGLHLAGAFEEYENA